MARNLTRFEAAFAALPEGRFFGRAEGRRYVVSKQRFARGKSWKLVAEELGGPDYVSLNLYLTAQGAQLRPCEMPEAKVIRFVLALTPEEA